MTPSPLAIVGLATQLPGVSRLEALLEPGSPDSAGTSFSEMPEEWAALAGLAAAPRGAAIPDRPLDWRRFRIPPVAAAQMHRMERLLLEALAGAMEDAGHAPQRGPSGRCGIYLGSTGLGVDPRIDHALRLRAPDFHEALKAGLGDRPDAARLLAEAGAQLDAQAPPISADSLSTTASIAAGRIAGLFDTTGGHLALDAGAASSLAALRFAAQALTEGHVDHALVGGVAPLLSPSTFAVLSARGWLSGGALRPLDERAQGTLPGEGALALMLRRLDDAQREGQRVYAVLRSVGQASEPNRPGVTRLRKRVEGAAREALAAAGLEPDDIAHFELQAPGIAELEEEELLGLSGLRRGRGVPPPSLGFATARVGFQQAASGLVSVVRAALALHHRVRPPPSSVEQPRAGLELEFTLGGEQVPLPERGCIGVSSHDWGSTAYHAILGPVPSRSPAAAPPRGRARVSKIAIIGVGAVAPGARDAPTLWKHVMEKVDAIRDLPPTRFEVDRYLAPILGDSQNIPRLAGVADLPRPDPATLRLPPTAIDRLDRAVWLALAAGEQAVRAAGYEDGQWEARRVMTVFGQLPLRERELQIEQRITAERYLGMVGGLLARAGHSPGAVEALLHDVRARLTAGLPPLDGDAMAFFSSMPLANRVAARFGFKGGALAIDAACASSLAAVHAGALALMRRDADVVVAGGVAYNLVPEYLVTLSVLGALSARGSFPFDDRADGFVPGEGAGAIVLKRLEDAEAARDRIVAVIEGIGASSDGRGTSLLAPSPDGQVRAVQRALELAEVDPTWVDLVEAHGTATRRGDVCEATAYGRVFEARGRDHPVALGSIKSQIGHLSSAAGMMGLIKMTYALSEQVLPPMNGGEYPNPEIPFGRLPLAISQEARPWRTPQNGVRRAGVSAFGLGGSNYHLVLEEHDNLQLRDRRVDPAPARRPHPLPGRGLMADRWAVDLVPLTLGPEKRYPLEGKRLLLLGNNARLLTALERALQSRGAQGVAVSIDGLLDPLEVETRIRQAMEADGVVDGVIDTLAFAPGRPILGALESFRGSLRETSARWFGTGRAFYRRFHDAPGRSACYVAVTAMGGDFGFLGDGGNVLGGSTAGFLKGLKQELPSLVAKAVDFETAAPVEQVAELTVAELENGSDRVEVSHLGGRRFGLGMKRSAFTTDREPLRTVDPSWVLLFSGGGRGAVFEVAKAMARLGPRVLVTGRTPIPKGDEPYLALDDDAFAEFQKTERVRQHKLDPTLTPVKFAQQFDEMARARELWRNLAEAFSLGLPLQYEVCDIRHPSEVQGLVARIRESYGRLDGVVHGAMLESSKSLPDKTPAGVEATLDVKVMGLLNLMEATLGDPLKLMMCFGSGAGRFGNRGQSDYCAANDLMSKCLMAYADRAGARTRCVTIDWTAWENVGAAARDRALVEATGVSFIPPAEGVYWFINELMLGDEREVAIFDERLFREWPFLGSSMEGPAASAVWDDRGLLLVPSDFPLVDAILRRTPEEVVAHRRFDIARDRFLLQHQLYGVPIVPCTFGVELLAEGAALLRPDLVVLRGEEIVIETPLKLFRGDSVEVELHTRVLDREGECVRVQVETRSQKRLPQSEHVQQRVHHRGVFWLGPPPPPPPPGGGTRPPDVLPGARARSIFHLAKDPVYLGPLFCRAEWVYVGESQVEGIIRAPRQRDIFAHMGVPFFQMDPLLLDTAFQVAANWDGHHRRVVSIPMGVRRVVRGRLRGLTEGAHVKAWPVSVEGQDVFHDAEVVGENGDLLLKVEGLCLRRLSPGESAEL